MRVFQGLAILVLFVCSVASAEEFDVRHVTAYGTATINVVPDRMEWRAVVRTHSTLSAKDAASRHEERVAKVLSTLGGFSIEESSIQATGMRLKEIWETEFGKKKFVAYEASTKIGFSLSEFERYSDIWIGLSSFPSVEVLGVEINHTDRIRYQNEARTSAVLAARDKAAAMAAALGAGLGGPLVIEEELKSRPLGGRRYPMPSNTLSFSGTAAVVDDYVAPGYLSIYVQVKGVFELLDTP